MTKYILLSLLIISLVSCQKTMDDFIPPVEAVYPTEGDSAYNYWIMFPNSFTPNGDGINDEFFGTGSGVDSEDYELTIYSIWGEEIFKALRLDHKWDGTNKKGKMITTGTYQWTCTAHDYYGNEFRTNGQVTLIR